MKEALTTAHVLALPNFISIFYIEYDASRRGVGVVLMQNLRPIEFFSKALVDCNLSKSAYEQEIMGLALAIQHWKAYLTGLVQSFYG